MKKHQYFDLQILTNDEVHNILDRTIVERETLAQWPLSCVEKVTCNDGSCWIVKSNHEPCNIEGHFYAKVDNPHVIKPIYIQNTPPYQTIIYRYIDGISFSVVNLNKKRDTERCYREDYSPILASISQPDLPVYLKIDTKEDFLNNFNTMLSQLTHLVNVGKFFLIKKEEIEFLSKIIDSELSIDIAIKKTRLIHGDFSVENILHDHHHQRVIILDWQRPIYGSPLIDEYSFVKSREFNPDPPAMLIGSLVQIFWLVDCAVNWFPEGCNTYNQQTKEHMNELFMAYQTLNMNQIKI